MVGIGRPEMEDRPRTRPVLNEDIRSRQVGARSEEREIDRLRRRERALVREIDALRAELSRRG